MCSCETFLWTPFLSLPDLSLSVCHQVAAWYSYDIYKTSMNRDKPCNLAICAWNMRGFDVAIPHLRYLIEHFQVVCVSEHWLCKNQLNRFGEISDKVEFLCHSSNRTNAASYGCGRGQGGVGILWNKTLGGVIPINEITHDRFCAIRIQNSNGATINVFSVYLPASSSDDDLSTTLDQLSVVLEGRDSDSLNLVCGDFNGDIGHAVDGRGIKPPTKAGKLINDFFIRHNLWPSNQGISANGPLYTYEGPTGCSTIDYIAVPVSFIPCLSKYGVMEENVLNTSDHRPVYAVCDVQTVPQLQVTHKSVKVLRWDKVTKEVLNVLNILNMLQRTSPQCFPVVLTVSLRMQI